MLVLSGLYSHLYPDPSEEDSSLKSPLWTQQLLSGGAGLNSLRDSCPVSCSCRALHFPRAVQSFGHSPILLSHIPREKPDWGVQEIRKLTPAMSYPTHPELHQKHGK